MKTFLKSIHTVLLLPIFILIAGCTDDIPYGPHNGYYPEGETIVHAQLDFEPYSGVQTATRSADGKLMDRLDDLCVLVYGTDGKLLEGYPVEITKTDHNLTVSDADRTNDDASNGVKAENRTKSAKFDLILPYGQYYIYGIANLGTIPEGETTRGKTIDVLKNEYSEIIKERESFLSIQRNWDKTNMLNNCEMLGYFTNEKEKREPSTNNSSMNNKTVSIDKDHMKLHSWLRRCASKVTVDFDGSGLLDNIRVYIRRVTIHDIPDKCAIGRLNAAGNKDANGNETNDTSRPGIITYKGDDYRPTAESDVIYYSEEDDYLNWPYISNGHPYIMDGDKRKDFHAENAKALFLYENMQGDSDNDPDNKVQEPTSDGSGLVVGADEMKDQVPYGSYIEVEGYYDMSSNKVVSKGKIIYRFMLGKDALKNFDVERNHHYKVTMCVRGKGNDVDWHIEYNEDSGFEVRDPYYVSYLYNHDSTIRFRYTPPEGYEVTTLDAEIVGNNWWPDQGNYYTGAKDIQSPFLNNEEDNYETATFSRNKYTDEDIKVLKETFNNPTYPGGKEHDAPPVNSNATESEFDKLKGRTKYLGNGFLSLRETDISMVVLRREFTTNKAGDVKGEEWTNFEPNQYMNDNYFYGIQTHYSEPIKEKLVDRSKRTYYFNKTDETNKGRERYEVESVGNALKFNLPVFTRTKNLVKEAAYTGNNPYESSPRYAFIRLTANCRKIGSSGEATKQESQIIRVEQVTRITNPKGIYRKSGNNENFHVVLTKKDSDNGTKFEAFESDGPWMAEVLGDDNFINLNGKQTIKGATNSNIDFNVRFNKMNTDNKVRNAVIRIRYHNYSCVHLIFVRQGYDAQSVVPGGNKWHTCNLICNDTEGLDPRDEGSLFKFGNLTEPIDVSSNFYSGYTENGQVPNTFTLPNKLNIATERDKYTTDAKTWNEIKGSNSGFTDTNVATMQDFETLYNTKNIQQGFGVLYADGATETQTDAGKVYGWCRHTMPETDRDKYGMCGVFIYYWDKTNNVAENYNNVFFPVGRSGYGHRRHWDGDGRNGVLRYSCGRSAPFQNLYMPLFLNLYMRKGAIYWARTIASATESTGAVQNTAIGLDLNFFTFDVSLITRGNVQKNSQWSGSENEDHLDACFLRQITPPPN